MGITFIKCGVRSKKKYTERERGDNGLFITLVHKFLQSVFLFVGLPTLGTLIEFDWLVHKVECPNDSTTNLNLQKEFICVSSYGMYINISAIVLSLKILVNTSFIIRLDK